MLQNSPLQNRLIFFLQQIALSTGISSALCCVSMTLTFYIWGFFQFKVSDSRQSLCRADGCINVSVKIFLNEIIICLLCLGSILECLGMQSFLGKCWKTAWDRKYINLIQLLSYGLSRQLLRKKNLENHIQALLCRS